MAVTGYLCNTSTFEQVRSFNELSSQFPCTIYVDIATPVVSAGINGTISPVHRIYQSFTPFTPGDVFDYTVQMVLALLIVVVNGFVLFVLANTSSLFTSTNFIIGSLALSDFGMGLARPLEVLLELGIIKDYDICLFSYSSTVALSSVSMLHLTFVSIDRYLRIKQPFRYRDIFSKTRVILITIFLWISSFIVAFLPMMGFMREDFDGSVCSAEYFMEPWFFYVVTSGSFSFALAVLTCIYTQIFMIARRKKKLYVTRFIGRSHMSSSLRNLKVAKLLGGLCLYFLVSWTPFFALRYVAVIQGKLHYVPNIIERIAVTFAVCNSLGNPLLYAYGERNIQIAMKSVFRSKGIYRKQNTPTPMKLKYPTCVTFRTKENTKNGMNGSNLNIRFDVP